MHLKRDFKRVVRVGSQKIGEGHFGVIAGPCSVESEAQILDIARRIKHSGARFLRGGAFKPRTSPDDFQGLGMSGLEMLIKAKKATGLPIVTELMSERYLDFFVRHVDMIQIGARNMQNYELLKAVGKTRVPVLLKRGMAARVEEFLMAAEYILAGGNDQVILCERGIRTFETITRNTLDLSAVLAIKQMSRLPVVVDPSHATGHAWMVAPLSKAAMAVGADGLMIEVHNDPENALCDGKQSITPDAFEALMAELSISKMTETA